MEAIGPYCHEFLLIKLIWVVLIFKSGNTTFVCDHSNESYWAVLLCGTVYGDLGSHY